MHNQGEASIVDKDIFSKILNLVKRRLGGAFIEFGNNIDALHQSLLGISNEILKDLYEGLLKP